MSPESADIRLAHRANAIFDCSLLKLAKATDQIFLHLLPMEYIAGILFAVFVSPFTWIGHERLVHLHVLIAVFWGLILTSFPIYLIKKRSGQPETRCAIAISQMLISALYIHLTGGRIETHFHVFGSLAILAAYRDYRVLVLSALVVIIDHMIRGIFYPQSVFGVSDPMHWRWLEHGAWIIFEEVFLFRIIRQSISEMQAMAHHQAELEDTKNSVENLVEERTLQLLENELKLQRVNQKLELKNRCEVAFSQMLIDAQEKRSDDFLSFCLEKICELGRWPIAYIYQYEIDTNTLQLKHFWSIDEQECQSLHMMAANSDYSNFSQLAEQVLKYKKMIFRNKLNLGAEGSSVFYKTHGIKSATLLPIINDNNIIGVLSVLSDSEQIPDTHMLILLDRVALLIGSVFEKRLLEVDLLKSSQRFGAIFNQSYQFAWILNQDGVISDVNQHALETFDILLDAQLGNPFWESDWFKLANTSPEMLRKHFETSCEEQFVRFESHFLLNNRTELSIDFSITGVKDASGATVFFVLEGRDITYLKTMEEQLKTTLLELGDINNALDEAAGISITDTSGKIIYANHNFCKMSKYSLDEIIGHTYRMHNSGHHPHDFFQNLWQAVKSGKIWRGEIRNKTKDGNYYWVETSIIPSYDIFGKLQKYIAILQDITQRKDMEDQLVLALEKADAASAAKGEFLANMSHEIRTPLNAILSISDLLKETILNHEQQNYLSIVHSAGDDLLCIINDILDFSKIESGKLTLENIEVDIKQLMKDVTFLVAKSLDDKGLSFECNIAENIPSILLGDPVRIRQILINLISNAIKFTDTGKITVVVQLEESLPPDCIIRFSVSDTGIGISTEAQDDIFNAFSQENTSTSRLYGGTGLGLSICKALTRMMKGNIWLTSEPGRGSTFCFNIGLMVPDELRTHNNNFFFDMESNLRLIRNKKVLLVDDNKVNQMVACKILQKIGLLVEVASNGLEAVNAVLANEYDFVLLDCQMPVMDGYEAVKKIRQSEQEMRHTPIIALTAHALEGEREKCLNAGMDGYLSKPFKRESLVQLLSTFVAF